MATKVGIHQLEYRWKGQATTRLKVKTDRSVTTVESKVQPSRTKTSFRVQQQIFFKS